MKSFKGKASATCLLLLSITACSGGTTVNTGTLAACTSIATIAGSNQSNPTECLDGSAGVDVAAIKGPAIINVWGSWCKPCKDELPIFKDFYRELDPAIQLIGVDVEEPNIQAGRTFAIEEGITWPNLFDRSGDTRAYFGMGVPVTWFIDETGAVVKKHIGVFSDIEELRSASEKAFGRK